MNLNKNKSKQAEQLKLYKIKDFYINPARKLIRAKTYEEAAMILTKAILKNKYVFTLEEIGD